MSYKPFPYPVLTSSSTLDADYLNSQFDLEVGYKSDIGVWLFQVNVSIKNDSILDLLKNNKAKIFCIIKSTGTFYLENFDLGNSKKFFNFVWFSLMLVLISITKLGSSEIEFSELIFL